MSKRSYIQNIRTEHEFTYKDKIEKWEVVSPRKIDKNTGFNATVFKNGKNIVVAYRGTEGGEILGRGFKDLVADFRYIVLKQRDRLDKFPNQFTQSVDLVKNLKKKYPDANITLTGHSLGGGLASYAGAMENVEAVTFSSPSVVELLPDDLQKKVEEGRFDDRIINYVHPKDSIGAGYIGEYDRHIGRLIDSAKEFHSFNMYSFDQYGNLINNVMTDVKTGKEIWQSPRYQSGSTENIKLNPKELISFARQIEERLSLINSTHMHTKRKLLGFSHIKEAEGIEDLVHSSLTLFYNWFESETVAMAKFIKNTGEKFTSSDTELAKEAKQIK